MPALMTTTWSQKRTDRLHHVLDHEHGSAFALDPANEVDADLELGRVETGEPFVQQEQLRAGRQRAGEFDALLVDIGEL